MNLPSHHFSMGLTGRINGVAIAMRGRGVTDRGVGSVQGDYESTVDSQALEDEVPSHHLFSCLIITGYPSQTAPRGGNVNPFADRPHQYRRRVEFETGEFLTLQTSICFDADGNIESSFRVEGTAPAVKLCGVLPTIETWSPMGPDRVSGEFRMTWLDCEAGELRALARTLYEIDSPRDPLMRVQQREITIQADGSLAAFHRFQTSRFI